jgi:hypothetical protein
MTTFTPATNIYAAIAAGPTAEEREAERRRAIDARLARQDRLRTAVCVTPEPPIPVVVKSPLAGRRTRGPERRDRADHTRRKAAAVADYASAFPSLQNRAEHGDLIRSLCARYDLSGSTMDRIAQEWRWSQGVRIPSRVTAPRELSLLRWFHASTSRQRPLPAEAVLAQTNAPDYRAMGNVLYCLRKSLAAAFGDEARQCVVYDRDRQGYYFDHELAATYPALMAILEEAQP